jgi:hypothetical protein
LYRKKYTQKIAKTATFDRARLVQDAPFHNPSITWRQDPNPSAGQAPTPNAAADHPVRTSEEDAQPQRPPAQTTAPEIQISRRQAKST